ncbi:Glycosyl transferases group 1 [Agrobacterium sp. DSM 25558]|uniref:glycosyltransferase n=1 Tax=Agrobacterium sp. DSM 25558 TaxID=1907665 RepID=UPI000972575B|nr:glycosyltransferase [Agrobacterium sp. DSM 25558]SCX14964.1 Glycosyl transferases group 1 [Agrobacterium sp. DSM 25558]
MTQNPTLRRLVVISDYQDGGPFPDDVPSVEHFEHQWQSGERGKPAGTSEVIADFNVEGGYIERLPLACVKAGLVDVVEVWTHWRGGDAPEPNLQGAPLIVRRAFQMNGPQAPFSSNDMLAHIRTFGPPEILCVWGLGVSEDILDACETSYKIYNSIDAPALRVPPEVSRHFDLILTGAEWQSREVIDRHPHIKTAILPIGPEFASDCMFYPTDGEKPYDIIYVAAAQGYKRHDILFEALAKLPRSIHTLCVFGYGEMSDDLQRYASELGIDVDFVGPPGVPFAEVNRLMNLAKIGVVCGANDGAPAIITEYMLAGLPVLANSALSCGLQYITPQTGQVASAEHFHEGISMILENISAFSPRQAVIDNWAWPHSVRKLQELMAISEY